MPQYFKRLKLLLIFTIVLGTQVLSAEKRALIVAIGKYPTDSGWCNLGSENDAMVVKSALKKQGFSEKNITMLINTQVTKKRILKAFDELVKRTQTGDIIVFHFSGHGQQVTDISGDEIDGLDEALVLYDTDRINTKNKLSADTHLIDDEINVLLNDLRKKTGNSGDVLFFIDACHSGTATRGISEDDEVFRGTDDVFVIPGYQINATQRNEKRLYSEQNEKIPDQKSLSPFLVISACSAEQRNKEYINNNKSYGPLSFALGKILSANVENMSYISLFESIRVEMYMLGKYYQTSQTPQMEGEGARLVFGGKAVPVPNYLSINKIFKNGKVILNGGKLAGIVEGTEIAFYSSDTYNKSKSLPLLVGRVSESSLLESTLYIPENEKVDRTYWAFVYKYIFPKGKEIESRANMLRKSKSLSANVRFDIIPLDKKGNMLDLLSKTRNGNIEFIPNDNFIVKVTNQEKHPVYFQLINILANNEIKLIDMKLPRYDYLINPGQTKTFSDIVFCVDTDSPQGLETILLIASKKILDLSPIETRKTLSNRYLDNEFELFLNEIYSDRSPSPVFENISIDSKSFIVK